MIANQPTNRNIDARTQLQAAIISALPGLSSDDVQRMCFLTMNAAAASAQADLLAIMAAVKAINQPKSALRSPSSAQSSAPGAPPAPWREDARARVTALFTAYRRSED